MLVLTRSRDETIHIGDDIVVTIVRTGRSSVRIGIDAPTETRIVRGEIIDRYPEPSNKDEHYDARSNN